MVSTCAGDPARAGHEVFIEVKATVGATLAVALTPGKWQHALQLEHKAQHTYMVLGLTHVMSPDAVSMHRILDHVRLVREGRLNPLPCASGGTARLQLERA